jgi:hypothetical protein
MFTRFPEGETRVHLPVGEVGVHLSGWEMRVALPLEVVHPPRGGDPLSEWKNGLPLEVVQLPEGEVPHSEWEVWVGLLLEVESHSNPR